MTVVTQDIARFFSSAVDHSNSIPYYIQVKEALRTCMERGVLRPGDQLPGETALCHMLGVSRSVIRQALEEMEYEGLIVRRKGKGTFIAEPKIVESLFQKLTGFYQDMVSQGHTVYTQVLKEEVAAPSPKVAQLLGLKPEAQVIELERLRFVGGEPITLVTTYLPYDLCSAVLKVDLSYQSLYAFLERECNLVIAHGYRTLEAVAAGEREAQLLQVEKGSPLVLLNSVSYLEDGRPLEYYYAFHRGDRSRFEVRLVRSREQEGRGERLDGAMGELPPSNVLMLDGV